MAGIIGAGHSSCGTERLAGVAAADKVDGLNVAPLDRRHVAKVRDVGPVLREHRSSTGSTRLPDDAHGRCRTATVHVGRRFAAVHQFFEPRSGVTPPFVRDDACVPTAVDPLRDTSQRGLFAAVAVLVSFASTTTLERSSRNAIYRPACSAASRSRRRGTRCAARGLRAVGRSTIRGHRCRFAGFTLRAAQTNKTMRTTHAIAAAMFVALIRCSLSPARTSPRTGRRRTSAGSASHPTTERARDGHLSSSSSVRSSAARLCLRSRT
jgi:hypothetical protein